MTLTNLQRKVLTACRMSKVIFRKMYEKNHELGYASRGDNYNYDINIASDVPADIKQVTLIHEAGHIYLKHTEVNVKEEALVMNELINKYGSTVEIFSKVYGGFATFLNICMDLEINSKFLTLGNVRTMKNFGFNLCTPDAYKVDYKETFNLYYEPLISQLPKKGEESHTESKVPQMSKDLPNTKSLTDEMFDLPEDMMNSISDENYKSGDDKSANQSKKGEATVQEAMDNDEVLEKNGTGIGSNSNGLHNLEIGSRDSESVKKFLLSIISDTTLGRKHDSMRIYNRNTRGRDFMYTTRKYAPNRLLPKLGIIVDISGSMNTESIVTAAASLKNVSERLHQDSIMVTCDTAIQEIFKIKEIPSEIRAGGGTALDVALKYLVDNNFTDIVVYSDFETDMKAMEELQKVSKANFYSIIVRDSWYSLTSTKEYFERISENTEYFKKSRNLILEEEND